MLPGLLADNFGVRLEECLVFRKADDARALTALDQHLDGAVREFQQLQHRADRAHGEDIRGRRVVLSGVLLRDEKDLFVVLHHVFEGPHGLLAADKQRHDHVREHHDVAERQNGIERGARSFEHRPSFVSDPQPILKGRLVRQAVFRLASSLSPSRRRNQMPQAAGTWPGSNYAGVPTSPRRSE